MSLRQYQLLAAVLATIAAGVFYLSTNGEGGWRALGIGLGLAYLIGIVVLNRLLQRRVASRGVLPQAVARVRWLTASEGGRTAPPPGPEYWATAVFTERLEDAPAGVHFSVGLVFPEGEASATEARAANVRFLAPELVRDQLLPGASFVVMEPPRPVAQAVVLKVFRPRITPRRARFLQVFRY